MAVQEPQISNQVLAVDVSDVERTSQTPSAETVGAAVSILQRDGIVVIKGVVDVDKVDIINDVLLKEAEAMALEDDTHFNFNKAARNISQPPPYRADLMFDTLWANPFAAAIVSAILGPHPRVHYANGNTALKSTARQTVHADLAFKHLRFPFGIVANYYLVDTTPENGSTEVWVGSHRDTTIDDHVTEPDAEGGRASILPDLVEKRRAICPPVQPTIQKGDLVLRDVRLWHSGMPNRTEHPRIMLAFMHFPWWYMNGVRLSLPENSRPLVERWKKERGLDFAVDFVDEEWPRTPFQVGSRSQNPAVVYG